MLLCVTHASVTMQLVFKDSTLVYVKLIGFRGERKESTSNC